MLWPILLAVLPLHGVSKTVDYQPVRQVSALETTIPPELKQLFIARPEVRFRVIVGPDGAITDYLAVEATHFGLLQKAEEKLQEAKFEPATKDGAPTSGKITVVVTFFDPEQRAWKQGGAPAPFGGSVSDAVERRLYETSAEAYVLGESKPAELDTPLALVESKIYRLHAPDAAPPVGKVVVEYYIDHNGRVRLPEIISSDDEHLSLSVLMSLQETRFAPPLRNGRPTYVRVRQPFNFD